MSSNKVSLKFEQNLWNQGKTTVAGIDEAGRGPLAGPVIAAAVVFEKGEIIEGINDSKRLSPKKRELLYDKIMKKAKAVSIGQVESQEIDRINILNATHKAMRQAVGRLKLKVEHLLVDGRPIPDKIYPQTAIVGGDRSCYSVAAASIVAKVYRDRLMVEYDSVFPGYGFARHKGYGTKKHREAIIKLKPCPIHRMTFSCVKEHLLDVKHTKNMRDLGRYGENIAAFYLYKKGYRILERNFRLGAYGELDIITRKDEQLCFVEVKTQRHLVFGPPESWVNERKMEQIGMIAEGYLSRHKELDLDCRFDVIAITIKINSLKIKHIKDAFRL